MPTNHAHLQTGLQSQNTGTSLANKAPLLFFAEQRTVTTCDVKDRLHPFVAITCYHPSNTPGRYIRIMLTYGDIKLK